MRFFWQGTQGLKGSEGQYTVLFLWHEPEMQLEMNLEEIHDAIW